MKGYNGWRNYETWLLATHMSNDERSCKIFEGIAAECLRDAGGDSSEAVDEMAEQIEEWVDAMIAAKALKGFLGDLLLAAAEEISFRDIARSYIEEAAKESEAF